MNEQKITVKNKYLTFPVSRQATAKSILFLKKGSLVYDLKICVDTISPDFTAYVDVSRFMGETLTLSSPQYFSLTFGTADEIPDDNADEAKKRPFIHHTVKNGWNNDPNGMFLYKGKYHLFYQYNPCGTVWGNMHWGHAVSEDLLHWRELDVLLFPDAHGTAFSGCAFIDVKNASGLKEGEDDPILLYYTACGDSSELSKGVKTTQRLAYSTDGGNTFKLYPHTVVEHFVACNRDPKVVWCEEMGCYVMALYLVSGEFCLLRSDDLLKWVRFQDFRIEGDSECPNIERIPVVTGGKTTDHKWVVFGASGVYLVGHFEKDRFVSEQDAFRPNTACANYAGQLFAGTGEENVILIDWMKTGVKDARFSQYFSIPYRLTLAFEDGIYYLRRDPVSQLEGLSLCTQSNSVTNGLAIPLIPSAYDLRFSSDYREGAEIKLNIFGHDLVLDMKKNTLGVGKYTCPLSLKKKRVDLRVIVDKNSMEIFSDGGIFFFSVCPVMDENITHMTVRSNDMPPEATLTVTSLKRSADGRTDL